MRLWKPSLILLGCALTGGCNSGGKKVTVTVAPTSAVLSLQNTVLFTATVSNATDTTVVWSVNGGSGDIVGGNPTIGTIATNGLYTAPATIPTPNSVTVKAVSNANKSVSATATVGLTSGVTMTLSPTTATMGTGETLSLTATFTGTTNIGVNWFVSTSTTGTFTQGGSSTLGTIPMTTTTMAPTCAVTATACGLGVFTAPATVPTGSIVVVKAQSVVDSNQIAFATLTIVTAVPPTLTSVTPTVAAAGSVFQDFYLIGTNFLSTTSVLIAGQSVPTTLVSQTAVRARAPASLLASPGTLSVAIQRQGGSLSGSLSVNVVPVRPALVSALPDSATAGTGATVTYQFNGGYFGNGVTGEFDDQPRPGIPPPTPNPQQLQVTLSSTDLMTPGLFEVGVSNPAATPTRSAVNIALQPDAVAHPPTVTSTIGTGVLNQPLSVAVDTGLGIAAVVNGGASGVNANSVSLVDLSLNAITMTIPVGLGPTAVGVDNERDLAVVTNNGSNPPSVSIINLQTNAVQTVTGVGTSPFGVGVDSIHGLALVALQSTNTATIIDLKTLPAGMLTAPCDFTATPPPTSVTCSTVSLLSGSGIGGTGSNPQVNVYPQLGWAIVTPGGAGALSVVDLVRQTTVITSSGILTERGVGVNTETGNLLITDPNSNFMFVFSLQDQSVRSLVVELGHVAAAVNPLTNIGVTVNTVTGLASVIDLQAPTRLATVTVGTNPTAVAIDPGTDRAVVANQSDGTISIINLNPGPATANPQIFQMDPPFTMTSGSALPVTLIGAGFLPGATVRLNGSTTVVPTSVTSRKITAAIPASVLTQADRLLVDVVNPGPTFSNVENLVVMQAVAVGMAPQAVAIDSERNVAVVTNTGSNNLSVVDLNPANSTYGTVLSTFTVGTNPAGVAVLSRTGQAVVANEASGTVSIVDITGVVATVTVSTGGQPRGVAINPDTGFAYVSNSVSNSLSAFAITTGVAPTPTTIAVDQKPGAIAIAPDLNFMLLASETSNNFMLFDITTPGSPALRARFPGPQLPTGVVYDPVSQLFIGLSSLGNNLTIINPTLLTEQSPSPRVGINPTSVAYNFQTSTLLTVNSSSNTISVMDFPSRRVRSILDLAGSSQFAVDIHPRTNIAVLVDTTNNRVLLLPMPR